MILQIRLRFAPYESEAAMAMIKKDIGVCALPPLWLWWRELW
jgi:hypothetical protein